jgi:hypothetical protein
MLLPLTTLLLASAPAAPEPADIAFRHIYNLQFPAAIALMEEQIRARPEEALSYTVEGAALLFGEFHRLGVLEFEFLGDDDLLTEKQRLKPDPAIKQRLFTLTAEGRRRAQERLRVEPGNRNALFATSMSVGLELEYLLMIEKAYWRGYQLSKEAQRHAQRLLSLDPPIYDAYVTVGSAEYFVGSLNRFFRLFVHLDKIEGSKEKAFANLEQVVQHGRFYPPFARILQALFYYREGKSGRAAEILRTLEKEFPTNMLVRRAREQIEKRPAKR